MRIQNVPNVLIDRPRRPGTSKLGMFLAPLAESFRLAAVVFMLLLALPPVAHGLPAKTADQSSDVQEFLRLLGKADVQEWLRRQQAPAAAPDESRAAIKDPSFGRAFSQRLTAIRIHLAELLRVVPELGTEIRQAAQRLRDASGASGLFSTFITFFLFVGLGFGSQAIAKSRAKPDRRPTDVEEQSLGSKRRRRLGASVLRELVGVLVFSVTCFAPFLLLDRDRLSEAVLLSFLAACAAWVLSRAIASVIAASVEDQTSTGYRADKDHICFWMVAAVGWFALGSAFAEATRLTGMDPLATDLVSYVLGLGLLAIGLAAIWRTPRMDSSPEKPTRPHLAYRWLATVFLVVLWTLWVADAMRLFWLLAIGVLTPVALRAARKVTRHLFPAEHDDGTGAIASASIVVFDTLLRAALIGIALWILAGAWEISFSHLAAGGDPIANIARALLTALAILFGFDVLWQFTRTAIDLKIARVDESASAGSPVGSRQARLRTLLPVVRNFTMVVFATLALLMTLSTLGIDIAPLIASAGVVGLAVGFGAQTLVKDIISGIFYLLDDAFRVGEYIVSGSYTGTVESFSLRSVRLRHHNGPVYTIPFSALGAVQNVSRNYAVDKLLITVSYDTDLEKTRKVIKQVGEQLMDDPELAPVIIEPLKMQAVSDFGTYGIQLKLKTTTKPGSQSMVRRKAFPLIKKAFEENDIEFAHPTIKVADGQSSSQIAAGQQVISASATPAGSPPA
ncbi:mechanosensitive ion channel family protein [Pseudaminobacter sp. NGMCC 1.201702]|uniref:mechanosensitive ion channel family protein n=1 Tax=Pseudaminobacter sp. NGMCC 1.201702 TaxID=3391825 RepID=UPI0039F0F05A